MIKQHLLSGEAVQYTSSGWSFAPRVHSGDCCLFEPITSESDLRVGDIVFCTVSSTQLCQSTSQNQPGRFYAHKITKVLTSEGGHKVYEIGNNKGHVNGYSWPEDIYGRLYEAVFRLK